MTETTAEARAWGSLVTQVVTQALTPLDRLRRGFYALLGPHLGPLFAARQQRVWLLAWLYAAFCFAGSVVWPLGLLALGPILWGIPHVLSDVRYLVVSPGHHRQKLRLVLVSLMLLASVLGAGMIAGVLAVVFAALTTRASWLRRCCVLLPSVALLLALLAWPVRYTAELIFAHAHNWIAVLWLVVLLEHWRHRWTLFLGLLGFSAALFLMPLSWFGFLATSPGGMGFGYHLMSLTPPDGSLFAVRLVLLFAFAQAFHYAIWLRLIPELARQRRAPRSFAASYVALTREFGSWFVLCVVAGMLLLALGAVFALREARENYLRFALFHGYLELAFATVWWLEGTRRKTAPAD